MIELRVLGTRGNIHPTAPRHAKHSGILLGDELLLDLGERSFLRLHPRWIVITHLHSDHAFFVEAPIEEKPRVYAPETHHHCRATILTPGERLRLGGWRITAIPTIHSHRIRSLAYRVDRGGKSLLYTGDLVGIHRKHHRLLGNLDLVITEGSFVRRGGLVRVSRSGRRFGHAGIPDLIAFFAAFTPRILIVHLGSWFYRNPRAAHEQVRALGGMHGVEAAIGWDGMRLRL